MVNYKLFILIFFLFTNCVNAQNPTEVIESYVLQENVNKNLSFKIISNKNFLKILIKDYYQLIFEEDIIDEDLENYLIVKNEFDLENPILLNSKKYKFLINYHTKQNNRIQFSKVLFSKNNNYAIFYEEEKCKGLCGGGNLILMEFKDNNWRYKSTLYAWIG